MTEARRIDLKHALNERRHRLPPISIIMPVFRPDISLLDEAISSVKNQIYDQWELCIVDDGSADQQLTNFLSRISKEDRRVVVSAHKENQGIGATTNSAVDLSHGAILLFLDQDDLLTEDCLAEFAIFFSDNAETGLAYSDSDKIDALGHRISPTFKPGWSPSLLLSYMYFSHAMAVRRETFAQAGGIFPAFNGSQDFEFALRASEHTRVGHIPKLLYHWRMTPGSTAVSGSAKPASIKAGRQAVQAAIQRRGIPGVAVHPDWAIKANLGLFEIAFGPLQHKVSIILALEHENSDPAPILKDVLESNDNNTEIILVIISGIKYENQRYIESICNEYSTISLITLEYTDGVPNISKMYNAGSERATGEFYLFSICDNAPSRAEWLQQLAGWCGLETAGAVGPRLLKRNGQIRHASFAYPQDGIQVAFPFEGYSGEKHGYMFLSRATHECAAVSAECLMTRRSLFEQAGRFRTELSTLQDVGIRYCDDIRLSAKTVLICPSAELRSQRDHEPFSPAPASVRPSGGDPYYNVNLGRDASLFLPSMYSPPLRRAEPVKVVFVSHNLDNEGAPITLFDLITGLHAAGIVHPTVLSPKDGPLSSLYRERGIPVRFFQPATARDSFQAYANYRKILGGKFLEVGATVVVANTLEMFIAINAATQHDIPTIWCHHESGSWKNYFNRFPKHVRAHAYAAFGQAYGVTYVAEATRKAWNAVQTRQNFYTIRYAIPPERQSADVARWFRVEARAKLGIEDDEIAVLLLGSVCARKGQIDLVQAANALPEHFGRVRFFIVGAFVEQRYHKKILREFAKLRPEMQARMTIAGPVDDATLFYAASDIFTCCSRKESAPRVLLEAMAFQLPIISTPVDGIPELVRENQNALFYQPGDIKKLSEHLSSLIVSADERKRLGSNGPCTVSEISNYKNAVEQFGELIRRAAGLNDTQPLVLA